MTSQTSHLKKNFLVALDKFGGNVSRSCAAVRVSRRTYYDWYSDDLEFKQAIDEHTEKIIDNYEALLAKHAKKDTTAVIFGLKCMGRRRGWSERITIETPQDNRLFEDSIVNLAVKSALDAEKERLKVTIPDAEKVFTSENLSQLKAIKKSEKVSKVKTKEEK